MSLTTKLKENIKLTEPPTPNSIFWEWVPGRKKGELILIRHEIWTKPMWFFHFLEKLVKFLDRTKKIILNYTEKNIRDESPVWSIYNKTKGGMSKVGD